MVVVVGFGGGGGGTHCLVQKFVTEKECAMNRYCR